MIVIKLGGEVVKEDLNPHLLSDLKALVPKEGVVIVHGGGDIVTEFAEKLGKKQIFVKSPSGITSRYTDKETVEIYTMVMSGLVDSRIVVNLQREGFKAVGLSGIDGELLKAERKKRLIIVDERGRKRIVDGGFSGQITEVNTKLLELLIDGGYLPVVSPVAVGKEHEFLNVDSDRAASSIAVHLKAEKIIFLTDVEGLLLEGKTVGKLNLREAESLLGRIGAGMDKKLLASVEAVRGGVSEAIITTGLIEKPLFKAIEHEVGTVITLE
ncbi:MAG: [LysW]-aminoadipate/[LysW]-glutamate kinase [Candidatus Bathyarchaeia archaeon]